MPLKVVPETQLMKAGDIYLKHIQELYYNYKKYTGKRKIKGGNLRDFNPNEDTRYAWFSLKEVLDFLQSNGADLSNPGPYGIRIYFGQHDLEGEYQPVPSDPTIDPKKYDKKDTVIFVLTINDSDHLETNNSFVSIAPFTDGTGMDNAKLCPPECSSTGSIIVP